MPARRSPAADGVEDVEIAAGIDVCLEAVLAADVLAVIEDVDVGANVALFGQDAVAEAKMLAPKHGKNVADRFMISVDPDLGQAVAEFFEMPTEVDLVIHGTPLL